MERTLYSTRSKCSGGCKYCFAQWGGPAPEFPLIDAEFTIHRTKKHIVYPCCDGDFVSNSALFESLEKLAERPNLIVSVSTKQLLPDETLSFLKSVHEKLRKNAGFLKLGVSITTKSMTAEIEPDTAPYQDRLKMLESIVSMEIPSAVILKPILPFIPIEEYQSVIDDTAFVGRYLTGSLYVHPDTGFFKQYIAGNYATEVKVVNWVSGECRWMSVLQEERIEEIRRYIEAKGLEEFPSDVALLETLSLTL